MNAGAGMADMFGADRYFSVSLQLYNWGTFSQHLTVKFSRAGHFITGPSGAGKSTILDARSTLMTPPTLINFNAASRDGDKKIRDRNMVTYVRGTWGQQTDGVTGEMVKQHLRPGPTWSAIAETYATEHGNAMTLTQIYWINDAGCNADDVKRHYIVADRALSLRELDVFAKSGFSLRALKAELPDLFYAADFKSYAERFRSRFNIETDLALKLLHKTQSAKNLDDLDDFLRNYMLDRPHTFEEAEALVSEFENLKSAHQQVVDARDQVNMLRPAREANIEKDRAKLRLNEVVELQVGAIGYRKLVNIDLLKMTLSDMALELAQETAQLGGKQDVQHNLAVQLRSKELRHYGLGGGTIESKKEELYRLQTERDAIEKRRKKVIDAYEQLGWEFTDSGAIFTMQKQNAITGLEVATSRNTEVEEEIARLTELEVDARRRVDGLVAEIRSMSSQSSSIPSEMLAMRARIAIGVNVSEEDLPFAGELMEVKKSESKWNGALERILRGFSLSILVNDDDSRLCDDVASFVNANDMRGRVVYLRTTRNESDVRSSPANHLVNKIEVKAGRWMTWVRNELRISFPYQCVDSVGDLKKVERGVTREGQIKHNRRRHEKDDRKNVHDRTAWVMGFDNAEKQALFHERLLEENEGYGEIKSKIATIRVDLAAEQARIRPYTTVSDTDWRDIDLGATNQKIKSARAEIRDLEESNDELKTLAAEIDTLRSQVESMRTEVFGHTSKIDSIRLASGKHELELQRLEQEFPVVALTPAQNAGLAAHYVRATPALTLGLLAETSLAVDNVLLSQKHESETAIGNCDRKMASIFQRFVATFQVKAGNLGETVEFADDYMAMLGRLETDNLPSFVDNFTKLLDTQSWQQLISLNTHITEARKEINERLDIVNLSLSSVNYNVGTNITIIVKDKNLPEIRDFRNDVKAAMAHSVADGGESAEARFLLVSKIVQRFAGDNDADIRWRNLVLDVREHVEFVGSEYDADGVEQESYSRDSGKSGGQKQKLAVTCLAAALRYQLGGNDDRPPAYSTIVLDEAFTRSDSIFTQQCMEIFQSFQFQMIIATPLKSVMALEPYVGGATFVTIKDRKYSEAKEITYDAVTSRLHVSDEIRDAIATEVEAEV